jgi:hypothetical protein
MPAHRARDASIGDELVPEAEDDVLQRGPARLEEALGRGLDLRLLAEGWIPCGGRRH